MDIPTIQLPFNIPVNNAVRYIVVEQIIQGLVYSLQQIPKQVHDLRKWADDTVAADQAYMEKYGKRPSRTLARRHGIEFIHRYDALLKNIKDHVLPNYFIHNICIILGPNYHNPKYAIYISFPSPLTLATSIPSVSIPLSIIPIRYPPSVKQLLFPPANENSTLSSSSSSSSSTTSIPSLYSSSVLTTPLPSDITNAVARKTARLLVMESANLYGLRSVRPNKLIILLNTSPLPHTVVSTASTNTSASSSSSSTTNEISLTGNDNNSSLMMPPGWYLRPTFALRPPKHCHVRTTKVVGQTTTTPNTDTTVDNSTNDNEPYTYTASSSSSSSSSEKEEDTNHRQPDYPSAVTDISENENNPSSTFLSSTSFSRQRSIHYGKEMYRLIHIQVQDHSATTVAANTVSSEQDNPSFSLIHPTESQWWQWTAAPCGFRSNVPPPVSLEKPKKTRMF